MVCQGYKAPDTIDPKLLDPKFALEEVEEEKATSGDKISSLKRLLTEKKNRSGYDFEKGQTMNHSCDLMEFINAGDPYEFLKGFNIFTIGPEAQAAIDKVMKGKIDFKTICDDLKVCGRKEFSDLLRLRLLFNASISNENRIANEKKRADIEAAKPPKTEEELEAEVDKELEQTMQKFEKMKKRAAKKQREIEAKQEIRKKMSVIAASTINNDDEMTLDAKTWDKLKAIDIDEADKYIETSSEDEDSE